MPQRDPRQTNDYDCGAFVLADMAAYMYTGDYSQKTQGEMQTWRAELLELLDGLPGWRYERMDRVGPGNEDEVIVIDD